MLYTHDITSYKKINKSLNTFLLNRQSSPASIRPVQLFSFSSNKINKPLPAPVHSILQIRFKLRSQFYSCCHRPDAWSNLEWRVVLSVYRWQYYMQISWSGRSLMCSRKSVGVCCAALPQWWSLEEPQHQLDILVEISHPEPWEALYHWENTK